MAYALSFILFFFNILASFSRKNLKLASFLLVLFMWILFWGNENNPDYINYVNIFNGIQNGLPVFNDAGSEVGFRIIVKIAVLFGMSYEFFLASIGLIGFLLIHSTVRKYTSNYSFVYILYFIFPFLLDVVQIRNFLSMALLIYAIPYIVEKTMKSNIKYVVCILTASTIHYSALLYLPFVLININKKENWIRSIVFVSMGLSAIVLLNDKQIPYMDRIVNFFIESEKVEVWFESKTNWGFLLFWGMQTFSFLMLWFTKEKYKKIIKNKVKISTTNQIQTDRFIEVVYWINVLAFLYFPFYTLASTFTRLLRNLLILNYVAFAILLNKLQKRNEKVFFIMMVITYVLFFYFTDLYIPYKETVIDIIFNNNIFNQR